MIQVAIHAAAGAFLTPLGANGGALFGLSRLAGSFISDKIFDQIDPEHNSKITKLALSLIVGIGLAIAITTASGFFLSVETIFILTSVSLAISTIKRGILFAFPLHKVC